MKSKKVSISFDSYNVSGIYLIPNPCQALMVLGHGAGAGMTHAFMEKLALDLGSQGIATLRYNFPYMEQGRRSPSAPAISQATVRAAVMKAQEIAPELPLLAGGKSYGGRMTSQAQAANPLSQVQGLVFFGFPLHAPGKVGDKRGDHLKKIAIPLLFLQGSRDTLADLSLLTPLCDKLAADTTLQVIAGADHGFSMLKSSDKDTDTVRTELAIRTANWFQNLA